MDTEKILKYIKDELITEEENLEVLNWIESSEDNQKHYNELKNLWVLTGLDNLKKKEQITLISNNKVNRNKNLFYILSRYAAIFILAFILGSVSIYFLNKKYSQDYSGLLNKIEVPYGEKSLITLYDGSKVWLNSGTTLKYPVVFNDSERKVFIEGEAYFDVKEDKHHPFIVNSGKMEVEVLGTKFNVSAYSDDDNFWVTLDEGSVKTYCLSNHQQVLLKPGQQAVFSQRTNEIIQKDVDTNLYTSWKENFLKVENARFEDVIKKMERWYDVKIILDNGIDTHEKYTMTIKTESLREMLKLMSITTEMRYEIIEDKVFIKKP